MMERFALRVAQLALLVGCGGIIVDGALDTSASWPKAFHDPQNTGDAGVTP